MLHRHQIMSQPCPTCRAEKGQSCRKVTDKGSTGTRYSFHQERRSYASLLRRRRELNKELKAVRAELKPLQEALKAPLPVWFEFEEIS